MSLFQQYAPQVLSGLSFFGGLLEAEGVRAEGESASRAAAYNARLAETEGAREEARIRREGARHLANRAVAANKAGVAMEGTTLDAMIADADTIEREALRARAQGTDTARLERAGGRTARSNARRGMVASILGGAAKSAGTYYSLRYPAGVP